MTNEQEDNIRRYLQGKMSPEEQADFEARFQEDLELKAEVEEQLSAYAAIRLTGLEEEKARLRQLGAAVQARPPAFAGQRPRRWLAIAAAVTLLLALSFLLWPTQPEPQSPEQLFAQYYEVPAAPETMALTDTDSLMNLAHGYFNKGKYEQATELYVELARKRDRAEAWRYLGLSLLAQDEPLEAIQAFQHDYELPETTEWYRALAYLKAGKIPEAKVVLTDIINDPDHFYRDKAQELREALE
jgi:tetratricopeptide (TPR) repeat protein